MNKEKITEVIEKLKDMVRQGNVSRVVVRKDQKELVNVPVNVGIGIGVLGLAASKWLVIAGALAAVGTGCTVEVIKDNDEVIDVISEDDADKVHAVFTDVVDTVKDEVKDIIGK